MKSKFLITLLAGSAEVVAVVELYFGEKRAQQTADSGLDGVPRHGVAHFGRLGIRRIQENGNLMKSRQMDQIGSSGRT